MGEILSGSWYRLARSEGLANEGTEIFIVADGGVEEKLIFIESPPVVAFSTTPSLFNHRRWRKSSGYIALGFIKKLIFSLFHFLGLSDFLELTFRGPKRRRKCWNTSRYRQFWSVKSCRWWSSGRRFAEATRCMSVRLRGRRRDQAVDQL